MRTRSQSENLIVSELSYLNFNSSVKADRLLAIHYANVVIKFLCGILDICLTYYANFQSRNSVHMFRY